MIEYLVSSIWGLHETEVTFDDLLPGIDAVKCLFRFCLLKAEFAPFITTTLLESTECGAEIENWWLPLTKTMQNALDMLKTAESIFRGSPKRFVVEDQCRRYILGLLTLILAIIDSFDIKDRYFERQLLDSISFDVLLFEIKNNIQDKQIHKIIEMYTEFKASDINEYQCSLMQITQESLDDLRIRAIQNGHINTFSNILSNLAAFPDDSLSVVHICCDLFMF